MRDCLLFDFFGTLVSYSSSWTEQGYDRSYQMLRELGTQLSYDGILDTWTKTGAEFEELAAVDHHEYSMTEACSPFLERVLGRTPSEPETAAFVTLYVEEWNAGVRYLTGIAGLLTGLAERYRLAVVSNTHQPDLVQDHLRATRLLPLFDAVTTSVELGWRKPHPAICPPQPPTHPPAGGRWTGSVSAPKTRASSATATSPTTSDRNARASGRS